jgi:hypothetical protein
MSAPEYKNKKNQGLCVGLSFNKFSNGEYDYNMIYNLTGGRWGFHEFPDT